MKRTLYLHVGTPKTGTSALQHFFDLNRKILLGKGVAYPGSTAQVAAQFDAQSGNGIYLCPSHPIFSEEGLLRMVGEMKDSEAGTVLVSSEYLFAQTPKYMLRLKQLLSDFRIRPIVYIRRQDHFVQSSLQQGVKRHGYHSFDMIRRGGNGGRNVLNFAKLFDKEDVVIRPYEKQQLKGGNIFADFLDILGLEMTDEFEIPGKNINPGFDRDYLEMRMYLNDPLIPAGRIQSVFTEGLWQLSHPTDKPNIFQGQMLLSPKDRRELVDRCTPEYEIIAREFLGREDGRLFLDPLPDPDEPWESYGTVPVEKVIKGFGYVFAKQQEQLDGLQMQLLHLTEELNKRTDVYDKPSLKYRLFPALFRRFSLADMSDIRVRGPQVAALKQTSKSIELESDGNDPHFLLPDLVKSKGGRKVFVHIQVEAPCATALQLYLCPQGMAYQSSDAWKVDLTKGMNNSWINLGYLPNPTRIRLDPGCDPGRYRITCFDVF